MCKAHETLLAHTIRKKQVIPYQFDAARVGCRYSRGGSCGINNINITGISDDVLLYWG